MLRNLYDLDSIKSDNYRPLDPHAVEALAASIKEVGLQEPIQLFEVNETKELFVISGHHRLEALKKVKRDPTHAHKIFQALITTGTTDDLKSQKTAISSVVSNILRTDLTIIDRAEAYQRLKDRGASAKEIGRMVQKDKRTIEMTLNVAQIPDESKEFVRNNPKLKDSAVYKLAVKYKKDPEFKVQESLEQAAEKKAPRAGATMAKESSTIRIGRQSFRQKLDQLEFSQEDVIKIMDVLETFH